MKKILQTTLLFATIISFSTASSAERFDGENLFLADAKNGSKGDQLMLIVNYCRLGDYPEALYWMEKYAEHPGEAQLRHQMQVAEAYATGSCNLDLSKEQIYPPNYRKAIEWYQRVASRGETNSDYAFSAKFELAEIYYWGKGDIAKDGQLAKHYYQELANISDSIIQKNGEIEGWSIRITRGKARYRLAQMYYFGNFARQDFQQAYHWAKKGWQDRNRYAGVIVATLQYEGKGTEQNREAAKKLIRDICYKYGYQQACEWHQDMRDNRPLRDGSI